jgi:hypothetical protein
LAQALEVSPHDLATIRAHRLYGAPKPPSNSLARLIVTSTAERSTEPPDSVRAYQRHDLARRLTRLLTLAKLAHNRPMLHAIQRQIQHLKG